MVLGFASVDWLTAAMERLDRHTMPPVGVSVSVEGSWFN